MSREQLLDYIKKQKLKIKKLEAKSTDLSSQLETIHSAVTKQTESNETVSVVNNNDDELEECFEKISTLEDALETKSKELKDLQNSTKNRIRVLENDVQTKNEQINVLQGKVTEDGDALMECLRTIEMLKEGFNDKTTALEEQAKLNHDLQSQLATFQEGLAAATTVAVNATLTETPPCSQCSEHKDLIQKLEQTVSKYKNIIKAKIKIFIMNNNWLIIH